MLLFPLPAWGARRKPAILERGKTRLPAEALRLRVSCPTGIPDDAWNAFE
ncbi:MAG: hypothetical protein U1F42_01150 [Candidatus Competibacteraceae bacterium]